MRVIGPDWLVDKHRRGEIIVLDGATGTALQARGVQMQRYGWSALAQVEEADVLRRLHQDYIEAGADVIITNTFAAGRHMLEPDGLGERVRELNERAVTIAMDAREASGRGEVAIAGSISAYMADSFDPYWLAPERLRATYEEQAGILAAAGVDLLVCEMMQRPDISVPAVRAAIATGLPVWLGLTTRRHEGRSALATFDYPDHGFRETVEALIHEPVAAVCLMHTALNDIDAGLDVIGEYWNGPLGVYPESGYYTEPQWNFVDVIEPDAFAAAAASWIARGARIVGGCCGIDVAHIARLKETLV